MLQNVPIDTSRFISPALHSHCGRLTYDTVVCYAATNVSDKHTLSIFRGDELVHVSSNIRTVLVFSGIGSTGLKLPEAVWRDVTSSERQSFWSVNTTRQLLCHDVIEKWWGAKWSAVCSLEAWWRYCISVISNNIGPSWRMWRGRSCTRLAWHPRKPALKVHAAGFFMSLHPRRHCTLLRNVDTCLLSHVS